MSVELSAEEFETLVVEELDALPDDMFDGLDNVVFLTEDRPEDGSLGLLGELMVNLRRRRSLDSAAEGDLR